MIHIARRSLLFGIAAVPFAPRLACAAGHDKLVFGLSTYPPNLQPWASTGTSALTVKTQIFRGLLSYGTDAKVQPELAEKWERDGETGWRFHLREAVFHDGSPVTAQDVKWSLEQIAGTSSTAYLRGQLQSLRSIETPDARTVVIDMQQPTVTLPLLLANPLAAIVKQGAKGKFGLPVGTGPYTLTSQERGVAVELTAFDKYYKPGLPKLKQIRMVAYADENARVAALEAGDVDMIEYVPWQSMGTIEKDPKLALSTVNGPYMALDFNGGTGPFKDVRLRLAVAHAIRREDIVKAAFYGRGEPLEGLPLQKDSEFYDEKYAHAWAYDPTLAKQLMAQAGVPNGFSCTLLSTAQYGMHKATAEVVQQYLTAIGIQVELDLPDWATRVMMGNRGQYQFCVQGQTADNNDPDGLSAYIDGSLPPDNARSYHLPTRRIHQLLAEGRAEFDPAKRRAIYDQLQQVAIEVEVPMVSLCWRQQGYAMKRGISGFTNLPGGLNFYSGYTLETTTFS
jgi:ABC-type transport system substrate-binding protein